MVNQWTDSKQFPVNGEYRYIRLQLLGKNYLQLAEVQIYSQGQNIALNKTVKQSSDYNTTYLAGLAVDGNTDGDINNGSVAHTGNEMEPYWEIDLGQIHHIDYIEIHNRTDCCYERIKNLFILGSCNEIVSEDIHGAIYNEQADVIAPVEDFSNWGPTLGEEWENLNLNGQTYYDSFNNRYYWDMYPNKQWALANHWFGISISDIGVTDYEIQNGFLNSLQEANVDNCVSICLGDENSYSSGYINNVKGFIEVGRTFYPDVLYHTNQYQKQWTTLQLENLLKTAKPDLLTYDFYDFGTSPLETIGHIKNTFQEPMKEMFRYMQLAHKGHDLDNTQPIVWGQYLYGYRIGSYQNEAASPPNNCYTVSNQQINAKVYASLLYDAKWFCIFRYVNQDIFLWKYPDGTYTSQYHHYGQLMNEVENLSPYLSRLYSYSRKSLQGLRRVGLLNLWNPVPDGMQVFYLQDHKYLKIVNAYPTHAAANDYLAGDVYFGYFKVVPGINETAGIDLGPVPHENMKYFMIMNGLVQPGYEGDTWAGIKDFDQNHNLEIYGKQKIHMEFDFGNDPVDVLCRVNRQTGTVEELSLTHLHDNVYEYDLYLNGGEADLFWWKGDELSGSTLKSIRAEKTNTLDQPEPVEHYFVGNPVKAGGDLIIRHTSGVEAMMCIQLFNESGQIVKQFQEHVNNGLNEVILDVSDLKPGVYIVKMIKNNHVETSKVLICN
ncbi:MAG: T9SS type A sorting domain-containing protein [Marinilabiliaceae bacterium]|nr:T9SS type A sorting domain-containing protein [Marinilabiliaceae bacterium]